MEGGGGEIHLQIASSLCRVLPISAAAMPLCLLPLNVTVVNGDTSSHTGANKRKKEALHSFLFAAHHIYLTRDGKNNFAR